MASVTYARGTCLGGCGKPRKWPWTFCGNYAACYHQAGATLGQIRDAAGRPPWRTGKR